MTLLAFAAECRAAVAAMLQHRAAAAISCKPAIAACNHH